MNRFLSRLDHAWGRAVCAAAATVAAVFCLVVGALLFGNYARLVKADPLNAPALLEMRRQFADAPGNQSLKQNIRAADLRARQVYFRHTGRIAAGCRLLMCGALTLLAALAGLALLRDNTPDVSLLGPPPAEWVRRKAMQRGLAADAVMLIAAALLAVWLAGPDRTGGLNGDVANSKK